MLSLLVPLSEVGPGDGATVVVPGSHKSDFPHPLQEHRGGISSGSGEQLEGAEEIHLKAGDALLFNDALDCDVCEGAGVDFGFERFRPVRSAVRENALWSIVILCSHGAGVLGPALEPTALALKEVIRRDENVIAVGLAMDALNRLANLRPAGEAEPPLVHRLKAELLAVLGEAPVRPWEALVRGGLDAGALSRVGAT